MFREHLRPECSSDKPYRPCRPINTNTGANSTRKRTLSVDNRAGWSAWWSAWWSADSQYDAACSHKYSTPAGELTAPAYKRGAPINKYASSAEQPYRKRSSQIGNAVTWPLLFSTRLSQ